MATEVGIPNMELGATLAEQKQILKGLWVLFGIGAAFTLGAALGGWDADKLTDTPWWLIGLIFTGPLFVMNIGIFIYYAGRKRERK